GRTRVGGGVGQARTNRFGQLLEARRHLRPRERLLADPRDHVQVHLLRGACNRRPRNPCQPRQHHPTPATCHFVFPLATNEPPRDALGGRHGTPETGRPCPPHPRPSLRRPVPILSAGAPWPRAPAPVGCHADPAALAVSQPFPPGAGGWSGGGSAAPTTPPGRRSRCMR